ncbi:MAG: YodC family protein [Vibrio sp.]
MSNINTYSLGDTVKLKSGGPDMSVKEVMTNRDDEFNGSYRCQWFAGKKLDMGIFPQESLVAVVSES